MWAGFPVLVSIQWRDWYGYHGCWRKRVAAKPRSLDASSTAIAMAIMISSINSSLRFYARTTLRSRHSLESIRPIPTLRKFLSPGAGVVLLSVRTFNKTFRRRNFNFVLLEADEGRLQPGVKATVLKFVYNYVMMPAIYRMFQRDERNRNA